MRMNKILLADSPWISSKRADQKRINPIEIVLDPIRNTGSESRCALYPIIRNTGSNLIGPTSR